MELIWMSLDVTRSNHHTWYIYIYIHICGNWTINSGTVVQLAKVLASPWRFGISPSTYQGIYPTMQLGWSKNWGDEFLRTNKSCWTFSYHITIHKKNLHRNTAISVHIYELQIINCTSSFALSALVYLPCFGSNGFAYALPSCQTGQMGLISAPIAWKSFQHLVSSQPHREMILVLLV